MYGAFPGDTKRKRCPPNSTDNNGVSGVAGVSAERRVDVEKPPSPPPMVVYSPLANVAATTPQRDELYDL